MNKMPTPEEVGITDQLCCVMRFDQHNKLFFAYAARDEDPIEQDDDFFGGTFATSHRQETVAGQHAMQQALALNRDWEPDLDLIGDEEDGEFAKLWIAAALNDPQVKEQYNEECADDTEDHITLRSYAASLVEEERCDEFDFTELIKLKLWKERREADEIGDRYAVSMDVYRHGGTAFSFSGEGMQCRWDTARGGGIFIPNADTRENIDDTASQFCYGDIRYVREHGKTKVVLFLYDKDFTALFPVLVTTDTAFVWDTLRKIAEARSVSPVPLQVNIEAFERAKKFFARSAMGIYNDYINGNVYSVTYGEVIKDDQGNFYTTEEHETVCGYYGSDSAEEEVLSLIDMMAPVDSEVA